MSVEAQPTAIIPDSVMDNRRKRAMRWIAVGSFLLTKEIEMSTKRWEPGYVSVTDENGTWTPPAPVHEAGPSLPLKWAPQIMDRATWLDQTGEGATAPLATAKVTIDMPFCVDPADLEAAAKYEDITRKVMENLQAGIEAQIKRLLADGITIDRIRLEQRAGGSTAIVVDNIPNSTFRITYPDDQR